MNERFLECLIVPLLSRFNNPIADKKSLFDDSIYDCLILCLDVLPVPSSRILKHTKIGKLVNKISKCSDPSRRGDLVPLAGQVVNKWKKELSRIKNEDERTKTEKKEEEYEKKRQKVTE
jgi:hypothetical protein